MYLPNKPEQNRTSKRRKNSQTRIEPHQPASEIGKRYVKYFWHPWSPIIAPANNSHSKPAWRTEDHYLQPSQLWRLHQNSDKLVGIRFAEYTRYATIDIDTFSDYHNLEAYQTIKTALENIGIVEIVPIQSSYSGGYHLIIPFSGKIPTFNLACALEQTIKDTGFNIRPGQIEIFPNPKPWGKDSITNYNAIRCPMQPESGALLLDQDLQPISHSVATFLDHCDHAASRQDLNKLRYACKKARKRHTKEQYRQKASIKIEEWQANWEEIIATGWTEYGQTNILLQIIVGYGIVFLDLQHEHLIEYAVETARNAPGYTEYCQHQKRIETRVRDWVKCTIRHQWYTPYASYPNRPLGTYINTFALAIADIREIKKQQNQDNLLPFEKPKSQNQQRSEKTQRRIRSIVQTLEIQQRIQKNRDTEIQNTWPVQTELNTEIELETELTETRLSGIVTERSKEISAEYKTLYNKTLSQRTLYKYKHLWHPQWYIPDPWEENSTTEKSVETNKNQQNRNQKNSINPSDNILNRNINPGNSQSPKNSANPYSEDNYTHFDPETPTWKKQQAQNPYPESDYTHFPYMKVLCLPFATSPAGAEVADVIEQMEEVQDSDLEIQVCQNESNELEAIQLSENFEFINSLNSLKIDLAQSNNQLESIVKLIVLQLNEVPIHQNFLFFFICSDLPKSDNQNLSMAKTDELDVVEPRVVVFEAEETAEHSLYSAKDEQGNGCIRHLIEHPILPKSSVQNGNNGGQIAPVGDGTPLDPLSVEPLLQGGKNGWQSGSVDDDSRIEELKRVTKLRLLAVTHAKKKVREYGVISGRLICGQERDRLEMSLRMQFYLDSGHKVLVAEATAWIAGNPGMHFGVDSLL
ncbi:hypothetical protein H6G54_22380 [Anabaena cylindrica FACHB-243]|uniref:Uncharacterized protein n=1 Tax=Anabaena cylindrica (strain ATCC 27899 / PCC 7122) TaxID=272123 RepID=K9ZQA1_ANACC|nr:MULTISPECIES: hypothetical protein [Anabaena]AFZ61403.1 hypothetical protein Anacy_6133 [Anabaena cylindrica PCC 7122]MBD2420400.1 hypothetical protein [Anabaena cylindrica FACHB-243]MBY5281891.1 hypothetical protein [Anabaena sp. CCAP 1446/1C]MBY5306960.1 hypothetical protein [Anabaena sp. CCAP 1446/1C]MCM2405977.1 hypothetical protein [Anabaena sp. CCAP 1446/1C]